jgi:hypothetical protein
MASKTSTEAAYWRRQALRRRAIARYNSGELVTSARSESDDSLWLNLTRDLRMANVHLRDSEPIDARFYVLGAIERAEELHTRGTQLQLALDDEVITRMSGG